VAEDSNAFKSTLSLLRFGAIPQENSNGIIPKVASFLKTQEFISEFKDTKVLPKDNFIEEILTHSNSAGQSLLEAACGEPVVLRCLLELSVDNCGTVKKLQSLKSQGLLTDETISEMIALKNYADRTLLDVPCTDPEVVTSLLDLAGK
jgi:hypothetical protein